MKKENKELAKQRKAAMRAAEERKNMAKTIGIICAIAIIIAVLIIVTAIQSGSGDADTAGDSSVSTDVSDTIDTADNTGSTDEESGDDSLITTEGTVCEEGDTVDIHFEGYIDDDYQFEGGTGDYDLTLGSHSFITGFEEGLIGHKVGETVTLDLSFPDDYYNNTTNADGETVSLAGMPVKFVVTINGVYK